MRFLLALTFVAAACTGDRPAPPADAAPDTAPDADPCATAGQPCGCRTGPGVTQGSLRCVGGGLVCDCVAAPDAAADAPLEAAADAVAVADAAPDAPAPTDAPSPPMDAVAVADAPTDVLQDVPPDRRSCGEGVPPRCASHADCAICLPTGTGTAWCCNFMNGFCRATTDRSTCE